MTMRQWTGWIVAAVIAVAAALVYFRPAPAVPPSYTPKDRHGMAFILNRNGKCLVVGGPETHIAFQGKKVKWKAVNVCSPAGQSVILQLTVRSHQPQQCPDDPFVENDKTKQVLAYDGQKTELILTVKPTGTFPVAECTYAYSLHIQGDPNSGIDPEMDIWP